MGQCVSSKSNPEIIINPNEDDCAICLDSIPMKMRRDTFAKYYHKTECGHIYCKSCILNALRYSRLCPMCRQRIPLKGLLKRQYEIYNMSNNINQPDCLSNLEANSSAYLFLK